jgi:hypothetical protein
MLGHSARELSHSVARELGFAPEVENASDPEPGHDGTVRMCQPVKRVRPVSAPAADSPPVPGGEASEIANIERGGQHYLSGIHGRFFMCSPTRVDHKLAVPRRF